MRWWWWWWWGETDGGSSVCRAGAWRALQVRLCGGRGGGGGGGGRREAAAALKTMNRRGGWVRRGWGYLSVEVAAPLHSVGVLTSEVAASLSLDTLVKATAAEPVHVAKGMHAPPAQACSYPGAGLALCLCTGLQWLHSWPLCQEMTMPPSQQTPLWRRWHPCTLWGCLHPRWRHLHPLAPWSELQL